MSRECGYTHNVSAERFEDVSGEQWDCPRQAAHDGRCVFHAPPDAVSDATVRAAFLDAVGGEGGALRLIGAHLGSLSLDYAVLEGPSNHPIDLREAEIDGDLSARYVTAERPVRMDGAHLHGVVDLEDATFSRRVDFGGATFGGRVSFRLVDFESWLDLRGTDFEAPAYMRNATFQRGIYGIDATFHEAADFVNTQFTDVANFRQAAFDGGAIFDSSTFEGNAQFSHTRFGSPAVKLDSATGGPGSEGERRDGVALSLDGVSCARDLKLAGATLDGDVVFTASDLGRNLRCGDLSTTADDIVVDCSETATVSGEITSSDGDAEYLLAGATVGELDIADDTTFDVFTFDETTFSGFDFGTYNRALAARNWRLHESDVEREPERLENLYLRAKNGANYIGETRASAEFFTWEMVYRRAGHRRRIVSGDDLRTRIGGVTGWLSNAALQVSCGYGERPFRPVTVSAGLVVVFAGVYAWLDAPIAYAEPVGYLTFSLEAFVSVLLGLPNTGRSVLGLAVALEGFLGGFLIALFVFALTRSISR